MLKGRFIGTVLTGFQYYFFILDFIDTKLYKHEQTTQNKKLPKYSCRVNLDNNGLELIQLSCIFSLPDIFFVLCDKL